MWKAMTVRDRKFSLLRIILANYFKQFKLNRIRMIIEIQTWKLWLIITDVDPYREIKSFSSPISVWWMFLNDASLSMILPEWAHSWLPRFFTGTFDFATYDRFQLFFALRASLFVRALYSNRVSVFLPPHPFRDCNKQNRAYRNRDIISPSPSATPLFPWGIFV